MKTVFSTYNSIIDRVNRIAGWFIAILLVVMTILISWQVFARFVMGSPLEFSEEIARFIMIWLTMIGAAYAYRKGTLISVDVLIEFTGRKITKSLNILVPFISIIFALALIIYGFDLLDRVSSQTAPSTRISMFWPNLAIPISGILILFNSIALIIDEFIEKGDS
ncbi:TRAP transporter small permease [Natribacillus halophilus]|uniref:TRAP-type C4-dicarboxylate transport system, small permease component n=1 Tax=Natribacillus halophilus TaxID=549003 RepID=A0A1G8MKC4_9BACI|nr:TRAP transporter small permease [Natribacillus halophilus]SDI68326.1 TRAP-type C4-dicarboxylate transport system, small permease component [Natribacillus halophilus]